MQDAIIIGAGITGLTAAYLLKKRSQKIVVLEKLAKTGGPISTIREKGFLVETGPNSLLLPDRWCESFLSELDLTEELLESNSYAKKRYIVKNGRPIAVPSTPVQAISTPLFSLKAKLGFLAEPFRRPISKEAAESETVASFVSRRMGYEFLDYAIDPFVSGVYAGNAHELILKHAFPLMRSFEDEGKSIIRGAIKRKKRQKADGSAYKKRSITFKQGLATLPQTLTSILGDAIHKESSVKSIQKENQGWTLTWEKNGQLFKQSCRKLIVSIPSHAVKRLPWPSEIQTTLDSSPDLVFPAVHSLSLGFKRSDIKHPLDGFGALVPSKEKRDILGVLFCSSIYGNRAPQNNCLLTVMIGGRRRPDQANLDEIELEKIALRELKSLIGLSGEPVFKSLSSWPRAIPQYDQAFTPWKDAIDKIEDSNPGLYFGGNCIDGIAMGASILSGKRLSEIKA
ncbi:protoporphyrinogen oxidase [Puniceicoccaceae bacterium K14]|nr:protoporphyrinogen oxidase [Puniceicoccaceae bacterium K14]